MPPSHSRRIVIDASIARASGGEDATYPLSKHCRDFLKTIMVVCHQAVMTPEIYEEWKEHESNFARIWRRSMVARKKLHTVNPPFDPRLRTELAAVSASSVQAEAMLKDCHLIEGAMATDRCIASLDENARSLFANASYAIRRLRGITWMNPGNADEHTIEWLNSGAIPDKERQLGDLVATVTVQAGGKLRSA